MVFSLFKKKKKEQPQGSRYYNLKVREIRQETVDAVSLVFEQPETAQLEYRPGQFVTLIRTIDGKKIRRAYSLCSSPFIDDYPAITIKRVENGAMSNHVNDQIKAGEVVEIMEPMGSFVLDIKPENSKQVFLFGGGSGITPLLSIIKSILHQEPGSKIVLVYANRDEASIIFKSTIEALQQQYGDRMAVVHFLETPPSDWSGETGYLSVDKLKSIIADHQDDGIAEKHYMTCGPEPMMDIVSETLAQLNIPSDNIYRESFVAGSTSPQDIIDSSDAADREVTIILEGQEYKYTVPKNKSILEAGLDENIDMPYSCQSGLCTACRGRCVQGKVRMEEDSGLSEEEKEEGYVLLCVGHAESDDVKVEIG